MHTYEIVVFLAMLTLCLVAFRRPQASADARGIAARSSSKLVSIQARAIQF